MQNAQRVKMTQNNAKVLIYRGKSSASGAMRGPCKGGARCVAALFTKKAGVIGGASIYRAAF